MMPSYDFECLSCKFIFEDFATISNKDNMICPNCKSKTKTLITQHGFQYYEGWDDTLQTYLTGPGQRRKFMKEKGIEEVHKAEVNRLEIGKKDRPTVHEASLRARAKNAINIGDGYCY